MLKGYFNITMRNILKHKGYSFINIAGLAMGMTVCILILLWVQDELSFDRFHENANQVYRVVEDQVQSNGDIFPVAITPWPLGAALVEDYPGVIKFARYRNIGRHFLSYKDNRFYEDSIFVADPSFLEIFSFPLVKGDPATALSSQITIVITEDAAKKYFGNEDPLGKTINFDNSADLMITGVIKNIPYNSHLKFDFLLPFEPTLKGTSWVGNWHSNDFYTYLLLEKNIPLEELKEKLYYYFLGRFPETSIRLKLQALTDIHLHSNYAIDLDGTSKDTSVFIYIFSLIAVFILLIACINFVNLTIARASTRAKEVGIRKVLGSGRKNLIIQFFGESIFLTIISFILAIILVYLFLPLFNNLAGKELALNPFSNRAAGLGLLLIAIITGIIAGIYPAIIQSSFRPLAIIKGNLSFGRSKPRGSLLRKVLVVLQFTCSVALIIGTLIVSKQLTYMKNKDLGYKKDNIIYFVQSGQMANKYDVFKKELLENPDIYSVTKSSDTLAYSVHSTSAFEWEGKYPDTSFLVHQFSVGHDYIKTFGMEIVDGRDFSKDFVTDEDGTAFLVNETAVQAMDLQDPVGKWFRLYQKKGTIIGVIKDFHFKSLYNKVEPLVLRIEAPRDRYVFVKLKPGNITDSLNYVKKIYGNIDPQYPLEYHFLDERLELLYTSDKRTFKIFRYFTVIAILISCLGLFGLAAFSAQRRSKEIGIRKIVGASITDIVLMLSKDFILLVVIANVLAWPIAYFSMKKWLGNFIYRTDISLGIFIFSALLALVIAIATVIYQSIKAASTNPVQTIRYE